MLKIENFEVVGWEHAIRGMRNPMNSWDKSDSCTNGEVWCEEFCNVTSQCELHKGVNLGPNDYDLAMRLANGGPVHAKYRRMIAVYLDVTAPLYWWKEFDTYKVGTVRNSCSTMHKIHSKEFTMDDFSHEHLVSAWPGKDKGGHDILLPGPIECLENTVTVLNRVRDTYLIALKTEEETGFSAKDIWWQMIQLLPSSYNQRATLMLNYEVLVGIYRDRKNHKLDEWHVFCDWISELPYSEIIIGERE